MEESRRKSYKVIKIIQTRGAEGSALGVNNAVGKERLDSEYTLKLDMSAFADGL